MTYVVKDACIKCKYMDCVEVCPVDCFYEGENMLVIHPDECIDCGVCEPECPAEAISDDSDDASKKWIEITENMLKPGLILTRWVPHLRIVINGKMFQTNLKNTLVKSLEADPN